MVGFLAFEDIREEAVGHDFAPVPFQIYQLFLTVCTMYILLFLIQIIFFHFSILSLYYSTSTS